MKGNIKIRIFLIVACLCWLTVATWTFVNGRLGSSVDPIYNNVFNATTLTAGRTYETAADIDDLPGDTYGAILPAPAGEKTLTAAAMTALSRCWSDKLILVIAFDDDIPYDAVTAWLDWQTPFGIVQIDGNSIVHLRDAGAVIDSTAMDAADDMLEFLPYFSRHFPDKRVVPLVFHPAAGAEKIRAITAALAERHDGFRVIVLTPSTATMPLFTTDEAALAAAFDAAESADLAGTVATINALEITAMKNVLKYDGPDVTSVVSGEGQGDVTFGDLAVFFGGGKK